MAYVTIKCAYCRKKSQRRAGDVNRAQKIGAPLYCNKDCAGLARRDNKTKAQRVAEKAAYDRQYRAKNLDDIKARKREYFQRTYDPKKAATYRKSRMHLHVEYCRQPEYKKWKSEYDRQLRANKNYGPFAEAFLLLQDIDKEVNSRMSDYDVRVANGTLNKILKRKREDEKARSSRL